MALLRPTQDVPVTQTTKWHEVPEQQFVAAETPDVVPFETTTTQVAVPTSVQVAIPDPTHTSTLPVSHERATSMPDFVEAGFEGVELKLMTFPLISLKTEGHFEDNNGTHYGRSFMCRAQRSMPKTAVQGVKIVNGKQDTLVFFTYDGVTTHTGASCEDMKQQYISEGRTIIERKYLDVLVVLDAPNEEYDQDLRLLSVSPTSIDRFSRAMISLSMRKGWNTQALMNNIGSVKLKVEVGDKVTGVTNPFYPWNFTFQR